MKKNKLKTVIIFLLVTLIITFVISYLYTKEKSNYIKIDTTGSNIEVEYDDKELTGEWAEYTAKITLDDSKITIEGNGVTNTGNTISIKTSGTFYITGNISDGNIVIEASKDDEVQLVLDNCIIESSSTAPINCAKASKLVITLPENSESTITDSASYTVFTDEKSQEPDGTIFTKTDLVINGNGKLNINANYADGIVSKDGLKIINSNIEIVSVDDAIRGKDYVAINNANIKIESKGDGIKSTNDSDTELGYIVIDGGIINISTEEDGIQAETVLNISSNVNININTNGNISSSNKNGGFNGKNNGYISNTSSLDDSKSSKGLKAGTEITINESNIEIDSTDDSIHSNGIIIINNGTIKISSGDDGIHADTNIVINSGNINVTKSYEGIESSYIEINGGNIYINSSDDGINVAGGSDSSSIEDRIGKNSFSSVNESNRKIVINDGYISVNATGDGLDANGSIYINGGSIFVAGPTSSGNGALDYDSECVITGGDIAVYGSTGMWQNPTSNSTQYCLTFQVSGNSEDNIVLKDSSGNEIKSFKTQKSYGAILISNSNIKKGETYTIYVNDSSVGSITANNIVNSNTSSKGNNMRPNNGGMQDMQPNKRRH